MYCSESRFVNGVLESSNRHAGLCYERMNVHSQNIIIRPCFASNLYYKWLLDEEKIVYTGNQCFLAHNCVCVSILYVFNQQQQCVVKIWMGQLGTDFVTK